jgi:RNA polymerase sigma factor FliA
MSPNPNPSSQSPRGAPEIGGIAAECHEGAVDEVSLWKLWRAESDEGARQQLLTLHMPYARIVAASYYAKRMHNEIEFGDYLQLASLGLLDAMERFDPQLGVQFRTFAARRMHGAILDGLEKLTEKQQQIAARQRLLSQRRTAIKEAAAIEADGEAGSPAARTSEQVLKYVAEAGLAFALSWILDGSGMLDRGAGTESMPFYRSVELRQMRERIVELVNTLPPQERKVILYHYFQEVSFEDVAHSMQLTRARISQIHRKALIHLKEVLRARQDCDVLW